MRRPVRGLLIGPLAAPLAYWIGILIWAQLGERRFDAFEAVRELQVILAFGLPVAYGAALVWGAPAWYLLQRLGWLRSWTLALAGAIGGAGVALLLALAGKGSLFAVRMPWPAGAAIGALAALGCWWAGRAAAMNSRNSG